MKRKRIHGKRRSPFRNDPSLEDYSKNPNVPRFGEWDRGTIKPTPNVFEKFKSFRQSNINYLQDIFAPGVSKTKSLIQATKDKLKKK
tara:strand:+ start:178 stop:438 length:261 start_codon:yes stop_codon:yes gene_type:complete